MQTLEQHKNFVKRGFKLTDRQIFVLVKEKGSTNETDVPFEEILRTKTTAETNKQGWLIASGIFMIVGLLYLSIPPESSFPTWFKILLIATSVSSFFIWIKTKEKFWKLKMTNGLSIYIHKQIPDEETVNQFISNIYKNRDEYLVKEYGQINPLVTYEQQYNNFQYLKKLEVFSEEEYERKLEALNLIFKLNDPPVGFDKSSEN